jgi:mono/diheme cytochrome c family protein
MNPIGIIESGDPYAAKMFESYKKVPMPTVAGMTKERCEKLLDLIEEESKLEKSQFFGLQISNAPFTKDDRELGRDLFLGIARLENGGTACISCHSMHDSPALGGGRLGPDLTQVFGRLEGRRALSAWLVAPGTETMQPIFKNHALTSDEIHALVAYFKVSAEETESEPAASRVAFLLMGLVCAAALAFAMDAIWKRRFHAVRAPLVEDNPS